MNTTRALLFATLLCLLAFSFSQKLVLTQAISTAEASKTGGEIKLLVTDGTKAYPGQKVYFKNNEISDRSKIFCPPIMVADNNGVVTCVPKIGFSPGNATAVFSLAPEASDVTVTVLITATTYVMGWVQIGLIFFITFACIVGAFFVAAYVLLQKTGTPQMQAVAKAISDGANGYMKTQYLAIAILAIPVAIGLFILYGVARPPSKSDPPINQFIVALIVTVSFLLGVVCSGVAGFIGMWVSVRANSRVAEAARKSYNLSVRIAVLSGSFAGFLVVALSVLGVCGLFTLLYVIIPSTIVDPHQVVSLIIGYSFGASFCALFAQLGGGIFTKAADVGADLVGKVEAGIPEDDIRNPAVIADLVGDNVGDCAGRGADLFESIAAENIGAMILAGTLAAQAAPQISTPLSFIVFPLFVHCFGMIATWIALLFVRVRDPKHSTSLDEESSAQDPLLGQADEQSSESSPQNIQNKKGAENNLDNPMTALFIGMIVCAVIALIFFVGICWWLLSTPEYPNAWWHFAICGALGVVTSFLFVIITIYYTDYNYLPVKSIIKASTTGPATNVISGIAVGLESTAAPIILISVVIISSYYIGKTSGIVNEKGAQIGGLFGTAVATMGMLSTATYILAMDVFGPITDNAGGIVEMGLTGASEAVRAVTDRLDAAGNTTKALTKGYAIGSAALASFLLFSAFMDTITAYSGVEFNVVNLATPETFVGALLGAMLVFVFSSLAIRAVGVTAETIIVEVRKQFKEIPGIMDYKGGDGENRPKYERCVQIVTRAALLQMIVPGLLAVGLPVGLGFIFRLIGYLNNDRFLGPQVVAGFLMVATIAGILMALFLNNGGGAWDNAKKAIELLHIGGGKKSETHAAAVIGDTIGDPFKDTAGPSIHVLIKLLATVTLVLGPLFLNH